MGTPTVFNVYRSKRIGTFYTITATPLNNYKAKLEIIKYIKSKKQFEKKTIGTYDNKKENQEACAIYFSIKRVSDCDRFWMLK